MDVFSKMVVCCDCMYSFLENMTPTASWVPSSQHQAVPVIDQACWLVLVLQEYQAARLEQLLSAQYDGRDCPCRAPDAKVEVRRGKMDLLFTISKNSVVQAGTAYSCKVACCWKGDHAIGPSMEKGENGAWTKAIWILYLLGGAASRIPKTITSERLVKDVSTSVHLEKNSESKHAMQKLGLLRKEITVKFQTLGNISWLGWNRYYRIGAEVKEGDITCR